MIVNYFFITDQVYKVNMDIEHFPTDGMVDSFMKNHSSIKVLRVHKMYTRDVSIVGKYMF